MDHAAEDHLGCHTLKIINFPSLFSPKSFIDFFFLPVLPVTAKQKSGLINDSGSTIIDLFKHGGQIFSVNEIVNLY